MTEPHDAAPAFERLGPAGAPTPLVCAVPHAGRAYPAALLAASAAPLRVLEELEDRHADRLVAGAIDGGAVAIVARTARAWIDLNRGPEDLDPAIHGGDRAAIVSARARSGLGLIPRRLGRRELWRVPPGREDVADRIARVHAPYHAAIARALAEARMCHGFAVLVDCHSMPSLVPAGARIVLGDRHGTTAAPAISSAILAAARAAGVTIAHNAPYAGAYGIQHHGQPAAGIHAVQIEIDRALYLGADRRTVSHDLPAVSRLVARLAQAAVAAAPPIAIAAE